MSQRVIGQEGRRVEVVQIRNFPPRYEMCNKQGLSANHRPHKKTAEHMSGAMLSGISRDSAETCNKAGVRRMTRRETADSGDVQ